MDEQAATQSHRERLRKVFEFLKAYVELRYPPVRDIEQQFKVLWLNDLLQHSSVELFRGDTRSEDESEDADIVLRITRPNVTACPSPSAAIADWVKPGWEDVDSNADFHASRNVPDRSGRAQLELFEDAPERVSIAKLWRQQREEWQVNERPARRSMAAFQAVYEWFGIHEREPEQIEILAGDGLLNCADDGGEFNHQVLLQRLELEFYPEKRTPQFIFRKREQPPELYLEFLRTLPGVNYRQIASCADELKRTEISPFGGEDTEGFLQRLIQGVFPPNGQLITPENGLGAHFHPPDRKESGVGAARHYVPVTVTQNRDRYELSNPDATRITGPITAANLDSSLKRLREHGWGPTFPKALGPTMQRKPVIFMRRRQSGVGRVFDLVLEDVARRVDFPAALLQIVGLAPAVPNDPRAESSSFSLGNEDENVLLSKPANKEQLEIARQLARRDCVLVQGPPGTGKTHTIANLLGHLLAQGKSVLVTAHTPKALRVLRQKVVEPLQPLCISVLQNDKQSQDELQQSVKLIGVGLSQDDHLLEREAGKFKQSRTQIIGQLQRDRSHLLDARQDETRAIVFGGNEVSPIDAAKRVKKGVGSCDWIPSPVQLGASTPLSHAEVVTLYQTNARVEPEDERELNAVRPDVTTLPTPKQFSELLDEMALLNSYDLRYGADLWDESSETQQSAQFDRMVAIATKSIEF